MQLYTFAAPMSLGALDVIVGGMRRRHGLVRRGVIGCEILSESGRACLNGDLICFGESGGIWLAHRRDVDMVVMPGRKVILNIAFLYETHGDSDHSFRCLNVARLKRSMECRRREGEIGATSKIRLIEFACLIVWLNAARAYW